MTEKTPEVYELLFKDINPAALLTSALHLCTTQEWPPAPSQLRTQAAYLSEGMLEPYSAFDAWGRVLARLGDDSVELSEMEKMALEKTKSLYDLKRSTKIEIDRAAFIRAYKTIIEKKRLAMIALPRVKQMVFNNTPQLPASTKQPKQIEEQTDNPSEAEVKELLTGLGKRIGR